MKMEISIIFLSVLILTTGLIIILETANAQSNSTQYDMKSITDNLNKSLAKLTGANSSALLKIHLLLSTKPLTS
jgi:lipopolysaccharide biosynthesis protein